MKEGEGAYCGWGMGPLPPRLLHGCWWGVGCGRGARHRWLGKGIGTVWGVPDLMAGMGRMGCGCGGVGIGGGQRMVVVVHKS